MRHIALPFLLLCFSGYAMADEVAPPVTTPVAALTPADDRMIDYLLRVSPIGGLVYGAFLLGRGVKVSIQVELSEKAMTLLERGIQASEDIAAHHVKHAA